MASFTELLPPTKSEKAGALVWIASTDPGASVSGLLTITGKRSHCSYLVSEFAADGAGRAFLLEKLNEGSDASEENYSLFIGAGRERVCECRGFFSTGACKHLAALEALLRNEQI